MAEETVAPEGLGEFDRLTGVVVGDRGAFADIAARPRWWVPLVLLTVLVVGFIFAFTQHVGWEGFMREQLEASPRTQDLPVEQREQILEQQLRFVPIVAHIQGALAFPVIALVVAGTFLFVFNILLGSQLSFRQVFSVTCYSFLPYVLSTVVALVLLFIKDPADFDLQNPVASNIGALLDPNTAPRWLVSLGGSIDVFNIWVLLLLATGFSVAARKLSWSKCFTWVVITWVFWLVVKTGWVWIWS